jgi:hypothetical protein
VTFEDYDIIVVSPDYSSSKHDLEGIVTDLSCRRRESSTLDLSEHLSSERHLSRLSRTSSQVWIDKRWGKDERTYGDVREGKVIEHRLEALLKFAGKSNADLSGLA